MSARGRNTRLIGSSTLVVLGPVGQQPGGGLLARRHQVGAQTPVGDGLRGLVADGRDLEAGEGAGVEAVLLELLAHGLDRVDGGEGDPLVAALDQAAHGLVHLQRVAGRLDRDGRHLLGDRAVAAQPLRERAGLVLGARHQDPPAEQRLGLEPRQRLAQVDHVADHGDGRRAHPGSARVAGDAVERRDHGGLVGGGAGPRHQRPESRASGRRRRAPWRCRRCRVTAESSTRVPVSPWRLQSTFSPQVTTVELAVVLGGQRDAGVRRDRAERGDARHDLEAEPGLGAGQRLLGAGCVEERVAGHQPDHAEAALGLLDHDLGPGGVGERLAVLAEPAVDQLGAGLAASRPPRTVRTRASWSGDSVMTTSASRRAARRPAR